MYVPILKSNRQENSIFKHYNFCFSDSIIPMIELIGKTTDFYKLLDMFKSKKVFIDLFRFSDKKYGKGINFENLTLSVEISVDQESYFTRLKELSQYKNIVPIISIKEEFLINENSLKDIYYELKSNHEEVGIRIAASYFNKYVNFFIENLQETDYLFFDIDNTSIESRIMELQEFNHSEIKCKSIILNSPRKEQMSNGEFEVCGETIYIDNSVATKYKENGFLGYGDYCGYKDVMPKKSGSKGKGAAIALIYNYSSNKFLSFVNPDTNLGVKGYKEVVDMIIKNKKVIENFEECPAINQVVVFSSLIKKGNWSSWIGITITRYIYQIYLNEKSA